MTDIADEIDETIANSDLDDKTKDLLFEINGDIINYTHAYEEFLINAIRDELEGFLRSFDHMMITYYENVLIEFGIDYFQAPFPLHYFNIVRGNDLGNKYKDKSVNELTKEEKVKVAKDSREFANNPSKFLNDENLSKYLNGEEE